MPLKSEISSMRIASNATWVRRVPSSFYHYDEKAPETNYWPYPSGTAHRTPRVRHGVPEGSDFKERHILSFFNTNNDEFEYMLIHRAHVNLCRRRNLFCKIVSHTYRHEVQRGAWCSSEAWFDLSTCVQMSGSNFSNSQIFATLLWSCAFKMSL